MLETSIDNESSKCYYVDPAQTAEENEWSLKTKQQGQPMRETRKSLKKELSKSSSSYEEVEITFLESLILAQDERWRRA